MGRKVHLVGQILDHRRCLQALLALKLRSLMDPLAHHPGPFGSRRVAGDINGPLA
ncbi:MAG: hypothetical protein HS126_22065 [Anaerolineales bacterium]|nr:hypothetical protein [Anaerolineales bacterium]